MRKVILGICFLVVAAVSGAGVLHAQDAKAEIMKLDEQRMKGISDGDMNAVGALLADDYIHVHAVGTMMDKPHYIDNLSKSPRQSYREPGAKVSFRQYGDIAIMVFPQTNKSPKGDLSYFTVTIIWHKIGGTWKEVGGAYSPIPKPKS